jgi:hypothetical protein
MVKRVTLVTILLAALFLGVLFLLKKSSIRNSGSYFSGNTKEQSTQDYDWKIPELPQGYSWVQHTATEAEMQDGRMFFDNRNAIMSGKSKIVDVNGDITTTGKLFTTYVTDKEVLYDEAGSTLDNKFGQSLLTNGWVSAIDFGDYYIGGIAASGVQGSLSGYVKQDGYLIRTIVYGFTYDGNWVESDNAPIQLKCPCGVKMTIFVGDAVDLRNYIHFSK